MLILLSLSLFTNAQEKPKHFLGIGIDGGASHLFLTKDLNPFAAYSYPKIGFFGGGEINYELHYNHFIFRTGFGVAYSVNENTYNAPEQIRQIDEYSTMQYHYQFSNFMEKTRWGTCYIPILFGGKYNSFYFLVGAKIGVLPFNTKVQSSTDVYIWGTDDDVINPMEGLYTHDMGNYSFENQWNNTTFKSVNAMFSAEIGITLNDKEIIRNKPLTQEEAFKKQNGKKKLSDRLQYKFSLFFDFGITNMMDYKANEIPYYTESGVMPQGGLIDIPKVNVTNPYSLYGYDPHKDAILNNFFCGIKFTLLYQPQAVKRKKKCNCMPHDRQSLKWKQIPSQK